MNRIMIWLACGLTAAAVSLAPALGQNQSIIATVNDRPVTTLDIDQQLKLQSILQGRSGTGDRKQALNDVINEIVKIEEAKRYKMDASERDIENRVGEIAKGLKTDAPGLEAKLRKQGIGMRALKQYVAAQISFSRLLRYRYKEDVKVNPAEVERKYASIKAEINGKLKKIMSDPRMKPVTVYSLQEVIFPVENADDVNAAAMLQSRAVEANQYLQRFKGCKTARSAASGIFNVKVGKVFEADAARLPKQLRQMMDGKGPGRAYGPMRAQNGIQVIAFCGKRTVSPKAPEVQYPTKEQIQNVALNEKYDAVEKKYVAQMRKNSIIEYKDQSYNQ
jgi:peptidyl-prolyl cis-trans isomerase SurA